MISGFTYAGNTSMVSSYKVSPNYSPENVRQKDPSNNRANKIISEDELDEQFNFEDDLNELGKDEKI